jgi:hypothetical protein
MKTKLFVAAFAILTALTAGAASADDDYRYRGDGRYEDRYEDRGYDDRRGGDWDRRYRGVITVRDHGRQWIFDRRDRLFYRLLESPFGFRPGLIYVYTDRCNRGQCRVYVYEPGYRRPVQSLIAPPLGRRWDNRWDDRRWERWDDRGFDDRDGRYRDDYGLGGGGRVH